MQKLSVFEIKKLSNKDRRIYYKQLHQQNRENQIKKYYEEQNLKVPEPTQEHSKIRVLKRKVTHKSIVTNEGLMIGDVIDKKNKNRTPKGYLFCSKCDFEAKCVCTTKELLKEKKRRCLCGGILIFVFNQTVEC